MKKLLDQLSTLSPLALQRRQALLNCIENVKGMFDALEKDMNSPENITEVAYIGREWQDMIALTIRIALSQLVILSQNGTEHASIRHPPNPPGSEPQKPS